MFEIVYASSCNTGLALPSVGPSYCVTLYYLWVHLPKLVILIYSSVEFYHKTVTDVLLNVQYDVT